MNKKCTFCTPDVEQIQEITRNTTARLIYPHTPIIEQHIMILSLRHVEHIHELTHDEQNDIFDLLNKIKTAFEKLYKITGYNFFANNGRCAGQHIPHVHFHIFGRSQDVKVSPYKILNNLKEHKLEKLEENEIKKFIKLIKNQL